MRCVKHIFFVYFSTNSAVKKNIQNMNKNSTESSFEFHLPHLVLIHIFRRIFESYLFLKTNVYYNICKIIYHLCSKVFFYNSSFDSISVFISHSCSVRMLGSTQSSIGEPQRPHASPSSVKHNFCPI